MIKTRKTVHTSVAKTEDEKVEPRKEKAEKTTVEETKKLVKEQLLPQQTLHVEESESEGKLISRQFEHLAKLNYVRVK